MQLNHVHNRVQQGAGHFVLQKACWAVVPKSQKCRKTPSGHFDQYIFEVFEIEIFSRVTPLRRLFIVATEHRFLDSMECAAWGTIFSGNVIEVKGEMKDYEMSISGGVIIRVRT